MKRLINATVYQDVLDYFLNQYMVDKFWDNEFIFQHVLAAPFTVKSTKEWLRKKRIPVFDWLANSLDANPIKNLCGILKRTLRKYCRSNLEELKWVITELWESVSLKTWVLISSLPESMKEKVNVKTFYNSSSKVFINNFS